MASKKRFEPTPEQRDMIEGRIDVVIGGLVSEEARKACTAARALPLFLDWSACMALRPEGEVIWIDYEEPHPVRPVEDERERNIGLFQGGQRHPYLDFLIPPRPADAIDCPHCQGTGKVSSHSECEPSADCLVCYCGGNGWLPGRTGDFKMRTSKVCRKRLRYVLIAIAIPSILFLLSLIGIFPWSPLNCWRSEIDINSGRTRQIRFLFWIPFTGPVNDSPLTRVLSAEDLAGRLEDWNPVTTLSPGVHHSPHHYFHGAIYQIHELESCWENGKMTLAARREMARTVLRLWQDRRSYFGAGKYLDAVSEKAFEAEKLGKVIGLDDLPKPDDETPH